MPRYMHLSIYDEERIDRIMAAMASKVRRDILRLVNRNSYSVTEIAKILNIPNEMPPFKRQCESMQRDIGAIYSTGS